MPDKTAVRVADGMMSGQMRAGYMTLLLFMALSGFGQMPIFKRYYIADVPGLGWLAQFYVTHYIHYVGAAGLLAVGAYYLTRYIVAERPRRRISRYGAIQGVIMLIIVMTGVLRVVKNYEGYYLSSGLIIFLDILHLAAVMAFLLAGAWGLMARKRWTRIR
ncbi:MAG: FeS-binding protein [Deltaproteobacteria bacterium]|jgi:hypothetical protein|nr:FeS-binding protein [Deltaproteobacteria bacterium]